jgi:hypothetical protein
MTIRIVLILAAIGWLTLVASAWAFEQQPGADGCPISDCRPTVAIQYYYQLNCSGPTGRGQHGCGGFHTLAECERAAANSQPSAKYWCSKEELCSGCEQFLKGANPEHN